MSVHRIPHLTADKAAACLADLAAGLDRMRDDLASPDFGYRDTDPAHLILNPAQSELLIDTLRKTSALLSRFAWEGPA